MKISLTCPTCTAIGMAENRPGGYFAPQILVPLQNNNLYDFTCQSGHHTLIVLQNSKHELLFESGILALKDGYYREAATSFAAALERFYEFMITALMLPEIKANSVGYTQLWKSVVNSSERQFGALSFLYFKAFGKTLLLFDNAFLKKYQLSLGGREPGNFRNAIVHQGTIPSYKEAVHYGEAVNKYMGDVLKATTINSEWKSIFFTDCVISTRINL